MGLLTDLMGYNPIQAAFGNTGGNASPMPPANIPDAGQTSTPSIPNTGYDPSYDVSAPERDLAIRTLGSRCPRHQEQDAFGQLRLLHL
jgi:hypothetical protein